MCCSRLWIHFPTICSGLWTKVVKGYCEILLHLQEKQATIISGLLKSFELVSQQMKNIESKVNELSIVLSEGLESLYDLTLNGLY